MQWYVLEHAQTESPVVFREQDAATRSGEQGWSGTATTGRRGWLPGVAALVLALLGTVLWLTTAQAAIGERSALAALGKRVCTAHGPHCAAVWRTGDAVGAPIHALVADSCAYVRAIEGEFEGMNCMLAGIAELRWLAESGAGVSPAAQSTSATRWSVRVARHFEALPGHCDQATPVIYEYFDCLVEGVLFYDAIVRSRSRL
jgi:hypothetical protein